RPSCGTPVGPGTVAQVGITILAPEGDGDINNYTLYYDTDSAQLAKQLRKAGVNAQYVPGLTYEVSGARDFLEIGVPPPSKARYEVAGPIIPPTALPVLFTANWWRVREEDDDNEAVTKMNTILGCLNRLLSVDRFLDSRGQSRLSSAW